MLRTIEDDLSGLAMMARACAGDMRPLVLRVQTEAFVGAPLADRSLVQSYEALALGLIPLVSDEVVAEVDELLQGADRTPPSIAAALARRLGGNREFTGRRAGPEAESGIVLDRTQIAELVARGVQEIDLALAEDRRLVIDGYALRELVGRARSARDLARALLARSELTVFDRASLYRHADETSRDEIRLGLERSPLSIAGPEPDPQRRSRLLGAADQADLEGVVRELAAILNLKAAPRWRFASLADKEVFAAALLAAGLSPADSLRVCLMLSAHVTRPSAALLRLARVIRTMSPAVAACLVREDVVPVASARLRTGPSVQPTARDFDRTRRRGGEVPACSGRPGDPSKIAGRI